jgi:hypothetical protein
LGLMDRIKGIFGGGEEPAAPATSEEAAHIEEEIEVSEVWNDIEQEKMAAIDREGDRFQTGRP